MRATHGAGTLLRAGRRWTVAHESSAADFDMRRAIAQQERAASVFS